MREFEHRAFRIHTANDMVGLHESSLDENWSQKHKDHLIHMFTKRGKFRELLSCWQTAYGMNGSIILEAHGNYKDDRWVYYEDGRVVKTIQSWVDDMDGVAAALMIASCNPIGSEVVSQKSLVMHAGRLARTFPQMVHTPGLIRLYVPGEGYLEGAYNKLGRVIDRLNRTVGALEIL